MPHLSFEINHHIPDATKVALDNKDNKVQTTVPINTMKN